MDIGDSLYRQVFPEGGLMSKLEEAKPTVLEKERQLDKGGRVLSPGAKTSKNTLYSHKK